MRKLLLVGIAIFLCLACVQEGHSQVVNSLGIPAFSSIGGGSFDQINLGNLNTHFEIPIVNKAGRGAPFTFSLSYDSLVWSPITVGSTTTWQLLSAGGWHAIGTDTTGSFNYTGPFSRNCTWNRQQWTYTYFKVSTMVDQLGITHALNRELSADSDVVCNPDKGFLSIPLNDGSGMTANISTDGTSVTGYTQLLNGTLIGYGGGTLRDNNGNQISGGTDTLGLNALSISGIAPSDVSYTYTGPSGAAAFKVKYLVKTVQTAFHSACSSVQDVTILNVNLVLEIDLPDFDSTTNPNARYRFAYEPTPGAPSNTTGRLASVTLPTGGVITYSYDSASPISCADGTPTSLSRATSDGTTTYSRTNTSGTWVTTVTDAMSHVATINFATYTAPVIGKTDFYETKRTIKDSPTGSLQATSVTCYNAVCPTGATTTAPFTSVAVYSQFGSGGKAREVKTTYNTNGQATQVDEYDFGTANGSTPPGVGTLLKSTVVTYSGAFPTEVDVKSGGGGIVAKTLYLYDQYPVTATVGTPMHSAGINSGNLTTLQHWVSGTTYLTSHYHYFDTGKISEYDDLNGKPTMFAYAACGNAFPTTITPTLASLVTSITWNCIGAVKTSETDPNGAVSGIGYADPYYWRRTSTTDSLNNITNITYPDSNTVESDLNFGTTSTSTHRTKIDGYGRPYLSETKQGQSSNQWDIVETFYDSLGRAIYQSLPYAGLVDTTTTMSAPGTATSFDSLSRTSSVTDSGGGTISYSYSDNDTLVSMSAPATENPKKRQMEINGLGQLTSVCEVTSGIGSGTCAQSSSQSGFWTTYTYNVLGNMLSVTQNAQAAASSRQSRSFSFDGLGRMLNENNPENGTTSYVYDSDSTTCASNSSGDLIKKTDAIGGTICSFYDDLHRLTKVTFAGGYASATPVRNYIYDSATVNGIAMGNVKGRLAEAYTGSTTTKITDVGFSYSSRGETNDVYELTPNSGTTSNRYNHTSTTYWANGAPNQLAIPGVPTITYQTDGEGRTSTVSASSGVNPVSSCCGYTPAGMPTAITFGSGDSDGYVYDPNTNRPTQYQLNVGTKFLKGVLGWNSNGSLASQAITDTINPSNTQTCNYSYDDLARLSKTDCGTNWGQTFSYDAFGNISKAALPGANGQSFQATYDTTNPSNRIASLPGFSPTYDAIGNLTNDTFHQYSWDSAGNVLSADSVTVTYDALDRAVEQFRNGSYTQLVYSPAGTKAALMVGSPLSNNLSLAFVALPARAQAIYNSAGFQRVRHADNMGSARLSSTIVVPTSVYSDVSYAPFGETYSQYGATDVSFTGQNQESVVNLYDFLYRDQNPIQGRWISPDPAGAAVVNPSNPQTWNRYAYVSNLPTVLVDSLGLDPPCDADCHHQNDDVAFHPISLGCAAGTLEGMPVPCGILQVLMRNEGTATQFCSWGSCGLGADTIDQDNHRYSFFEKWSSDCTGSWDNTAGVICGPLVYQGLGLHDTGLVTGLVSVPGFDHPNSAKHEEWEPTHEPSWLNKYVTQVSCEGAVTMALIEEEDQDRAVVAGTAAALYGGYTGNLKIAATGLAIVGSVSISDALRSRHICVPIAWGEGYK